jgi:hypothetical protein
MSRKSRPRKNTGRKLASVRDEPVAPAVEPELGTVHHLSPEARGTLDAIMMGCTFMAQDSFADVPTDGEDQGFIGFGDRLEDDDELGEDEEADESFDESFEDDDELDAEMDELANSLGAVALTTRVLARALLAQVLGREPQHLRAAGIPLPPIDGDAADSVMLDEITRDLLPPSIPTVANQSRAEREEIIDEAALLIREIGLEEFDSHCELDVLRDGSAELYAYPVTPEVANISLLEFLFERAETAAVNGDPFVVIERDASYWEFSCWAVAPPPGAGADEIAAFARHVREQEYSLVERPSIALGASVMNDLANGDGFSELFPRQHRMAGALGLSFADVFECTSLEGNRAVFRSVSTGESFDVFEHMDPVAYSTGWIGLGRLLPFDDDGLHLRSPGMIFVRPQRPDLARDAADALRRYEDVVPQALAVEAVISSIVFGVSVPRPTKPHRSRAQARQALDTYREVFAGTQWENVLMRRGTPADDTAEHATIGHEHVPAYYVPIRLDATLDAYMTAVVEQAEAGGGGTEKRRARKSKKARRWR